MTVHDGLSCVMWQAVLQDKSQTGSDTGSGGGSTGSSHAENANKSAANANGNTAPINGEAKDGTNPATPAPVESGLAPAKTPSKKVGKTPSSKRGAKTPGRGGRGGKRKVAAGSAEEASASELSTPGSPAVKVTCTNYF
jgi:hypothetical protein